MPRREQENDQFRRLHRIPAGELRRRFQTDDEDNDEQDRYSGQSMGKTRADDDFRDTPELISSIPAINGRAVFFTGKGEMVSIKFDKEHPEVVVAAEDIEIPRNSRVLILDAAEGFMGITLAAIHRDSRFFLYDSNLGKAAIAQRNVDANGEIAPNVQVLLEEEVESLFQQGVNVVVLRPPGFTAMELIEDRVTMASQVLPVGGELFIVSNKKSGADRHESMVERALGEGNVEIVGRGKGGFRIIRGVKTEETYNQTQDLKQTVTFSVLGREFSVHTEPSLFSRKDLDVGTRFLLENVDLTGFVRMLDIGSGWGPIGIVAATINESGSVVETDIDTRAVRVARENIQELGLEERVEVQATDDIKTISGNFDLILSNPPFHADTKVLTAVFEAARDKLAKKGQLYIVVEDTYREKLEDILSQVFGNAVLYAQDTNIKFSIFMVRK